jgi:O-acetyl-ADP-ribose deacetylase (regulator of RNase III)
MGEIRQLRGNIFSTTANVLVNTVNCVGIMGAGLALECRYRYPQMYLEYRRACELRQISPGRLQLWKFSRPWVLNFPTKAHWRYPSKLEYIRDGLRSFEQLCEGSSLESVAFPRLGTAHGGLGWSEVEPLMLECLSRIRGVDFEIWEFDPRAADPSYLRLKEYAARVGQADFVRELGLRSPQAGLVWEALGSRDVGSLLALQHVEGVGPKTVERIYKWLFGSKSREAIAGSGSLFGAL